VIAPFEMPLLVIFSGGPPVPRFSANISTLYTEVPFLERFAAAKEDGFDAVEFWFPYEHPLESIRSQLQENELELVGINSHSGSASEWGLAAVPGREEAFASTIDQAIEYAAGLGAGGLHVMAGLAQGHASEVVE
jgi:hydroxypyruvate isomerase